MKHDYDKTVTRLITILSKFSQNEIVNPKDLAQEFNVSVRTIQKDLKLLIDFDLIEKIKAPKNKKKNYFRLNIDL